MDGRNPKMLDRDGVERIVHAALGRQLKVTALLALLLGVVGFVLGHFVAASHSRLAAERMEDQIYGLQSQLTHLADRCSQQEQQQTRLTLAVTDIEVLRREEAERDRTVLKTLAEVITNRRMAWLRDLERYTEGRRHVPPEMVAGAINRYVDEQIAVLDRVLRMTADRVEPAAPRETAHTATSGVHGFPDGAREDPAQKTTEEAQRSRSAEATALPAGSGTGTHVSHPAEESARSGSTDDRQQYFAPPRRRGFLFYSPSQPRPIESARVSESAAIPLPPR